jgi:hypothetical protein
MGGLWYGITRVRKEGSVVAKSIHRFCWGVAGGSVTGLQNFLKDALTIANDPSIDSGTTWYLYLFVTFAIITALAGLLLLTACMKRYDATYSAAMFVGAFVVCASVMSAVHYHTFENLNTPLNYTMYPTGLVILLLGVLVLIQEADEDASSVQATNDDFVDEIDTFGLPCQEIHASAGLNESECKNQSIIKEGANPNLYRI